MKIKKKRENELGDTIIVGWFDVYGSFFEWVFASDNVFRIYPTARFSIRRHKTTNSEYDFGSLMGTEDLLELSKNFFSKIGVGAKGKPDTIVIDKKGSLRTELNTLHVFKKRSSN